MQADPAVMTLSDAIGRLCQALGLMGLLALPVTLILALGGDARLFLLSAVLAALPIVVALLQLALSRSRGFDADLAAARLTGDPEGLACALEVLDRDHRSHLGTLARGPGATAGPAAAADTPRDRAADPTTA